MRSTGIIIPHAELIASFIYSFHMPLFFMMSGYIHALREHNNQTYAFYVKKYAVELYLPGLFFAVLQWSLNYFLFTGSFNPANFKGATISELYAILFIGFNNCWFLCTLFFVKVIYVFIERRDFDKKIDTALWIAVFVLCRLAGGSISNFAHVLYFHLGYMIKRNDFVSISRNPGCLSGILLLCIGLALFGAGRFYGSSIITSAFTALCLSLSMFVMFYSLRITNTFLALCGVFSMVIYCLHNFVVASLRLLYKYGMFSCIDYPVVLMIIFLTAGVLVPLFVVWLYKNVKCLHWIEYIFYPGKLLLKH